MPAGALHRLLRALAAVGVLHEEPDGVFGLTALGETLRGPEGSLAAFHGRPSHWTAWGQLLHSVRTGENAFQAVHGVDVWEYRAQHPEEAAVFDAAMTGSSRRVNAAVAAAHDFGRYGVIVDVGGGHGALLAGILARHPGVRGVLFDRRPWSPAPTPTASRWSAAASSSSSPRAGTPTCSRPCCTTGRTSRRSRSCAPGAARPAGTALLVIERRFALAATKLSDLNMLVGPGGRERTTEEYAALRAAADYELVAETPTAAEVSVIEARAV